MSEKNETLENRSGQSIDQIREIIFGEQIIEFENAIKQLRQENKNLKSQIADLVKKHEHDIDQIKAESSENHSQSVSNFNQHSQLIEELKSEIIQKLSELDDRKVDKTQIGQAFIDWGMKVKQPSKKAE